MKTLDPVFDIPAIASGARIAPEIEALRCNKPDPVPDDDEDDDEDDDRGSSGGNIDPDDDEGDFEDEDEDDDDETLWTRRHSDTGRDPVSQRHPGLADALDGSQFGRFPGLRRADIQR